MSRMRFFGFMLAAWVTPPVVAGALGWEGIWGSGSAFIDYLIPLPVAGGALHVPSFVVAMAAVGGYARLGDRVAAIVRAAFVGFALLGLAWLIDVERLALVASTDLEYTRIPWQENPLGLFVLSDSLWALAWMASAPPLGTVLWRAVAVALVLPALYLVGSIKSNARLAEPFVLGQSRPEPARGDETQWVYTRLSMTDPTFRSKALAWIEPRRPERAMNVEDVAFLFTDSLEAASGLETAPAAATLCVHEDGTPDRWLSGGADCFGDHVTFSDRVAAAAASIPRDVPADVRSYLVARSLCRNVTRADPGNDVLAEQAFCRGFDLEQMWRALQAGYRPEHLDAWTSRSE